MNLAEIKDKLSNMTSACVCRACVNRRIKIHKGIWECVSITISPDVTHEDLCASDWDFVHFSYDE